MWLLVVRWSVVEDKEANSSLILLHEDTFYNIRNIMDISIGIATMRLLG